MFRDGIASVIHYDPDGKLRIASSTVRNGEASIQRHIDVIRPVANVAGHIKLAVRTRGIRDGRGSTETGQQDKQVLHARDPTVSDARCHVKFASAIVIASFCQRIDISFGKEP